MLIRTPPALLPINRRIRSSDTLKVLKSFKNIARMANDVHIDHNSEYRSTGGGVIFQDGVLFSTENAIFWPISADFGYFVVLFGVLFRPK